METDVGTWVFGLFVPLHFRPREQKVHRENFRSRGTFVPYNIRSRGAKSPQMELSFPWNFRSGEHLLLGAFALVVERSFLGSERSKNFCSLELSFLWNFHSFGTNRLFQELSLQASKTI